MNAGPGRAVLITGCSTGIGRATALRLDGAGWRVFAGVRSDQAAEELAAAASERLTPVIVDITDSASIDLCRERIEAAAPGGIHGLVNNAGTAHMGPLEFIPPEDLRRQLEVNFVGHIAMTQAMIPSLRKTRGRIVNITSLGGVVASPFLGPYCASKYALEAAGDCLRIELRPWGIETIAIEPGAVATEIWSSGSRIFDELRERLPPRAIELYERAMQASARAGVETGARGIPPERAAELIERALTVARPRPRYLLGRDAYAMVTARRLLPTRATDSLLARVLRLP